ncbi:unnamed protein product [Rotaria sp. Silwood1]|nr:unnamed protein product [Rotaria sp. Silwood1]
MNDYISSVSMLEHFSNELLIETFEYLSVQDLYNGFYGINIRFTSILASLTNLWGKLTSNKDALLPAFRFFASGITMLDVDYADPIDLSLFHAIRSLRLSREPDCGISHSILELSNLEHLYVTYHSSMIFEVQNPLSIFVFGNYFPHLRTCQLSQVKLNKDYKWSIVSSLRSLYISTDDILVYIQILQSCPSLDQLCIEFTNHKCMVSSFDCTPHQFLRRLDLYFQYVRLINSQTIDLLLSVVPNVIYFSINRIRNNRNPVTDDSLVPILHKRLPKLRHFHINVMYYTLVTILSDSDDDIDDDDTDDDDTDDDL